MMENEFPETQLQLLDVCNRATCESRNTSDDVDSLRQCSYWLHKFDRSWPAGETQSPPRCCLRLVMHLIGECLGRHDRRPVHSAGWRDLERRHRFNRSM